MFEPHAAPTRNIKNDVLSGLTVALALVPEAVAFAFVAGVDPLVGLYAAFMVGLITASIGGRPGRAQVGGWAGHRTTAGANHSSGSGESSRCRLCDHPRL